MASSLVSSQLVCDTDAARRAKVRSVAGRVLAFWHLSSLDAPTVAVVWALAMAQSAHVHLQPWVALLLASGTWTVYVLDRILDAHRSTRARSLAALQERHHFHWRHRASLIPLAICTAAVALAIIFRLMPAVTREHDSVIAAAALAYFSGVHASGRFPRYLRRLFSKEMLVGVLFSAGCAAPTLTRLHSPSAWAVVLTLAFFSALAWLNCTAISSWESQDSLANIPGVALAVALPGLAIAAVLPAPATPTSALLAAGALSALLLLALHMLRQHLSPVLLRALADLVLLVPAVLLIPGAVRG